MFYNDNKTDYGHPGIVNVVISSDRSALKHTWQTAVITTAVGWTASVLPQGIRQPNNANSSMPGCLGLMQLLHKAQPCWVPTRMLSSQYSKHLISSLVMWNKALSAVTLLGQYASSLWSSGDSPKLVVGLKVLFCLCTWQAWALGFAKFELMNARTIVVIRLTGDTQYTISVNLNRRINKCLRALVE